MDTIIHYSSVPSTDEQATLDSTTKNVPTFEELHTKHYDEVKRRICILLRYRPDLIDDAIQETWVKVWRFLPQITSTHNLKSWLWLVATNTVRDVLRRQKTWDTHHTSLEGTLEYFDIAPEHYEHALVPDTHDYLPALLDRQARRVAIWSHLSAKDRQTFIAYASRQPVKKQDLYAARRRYKRAVASEQEGIAS